MQTHLLYTEHNVHIESYMYYVFKKYQIRFNAFKMNPLFNVNYTTEHFYLDVKCWTSRI